LRRAQARYNLKLLEESKDDIRQLLLLDEKNEAGRKLQNKLKIEINLKEALALKALGDTAFKSKDFKAALIHYDQSSKSLDGPENQIDLIKV